MSTIVTDINNLYSSNSNNEMVISYKGPFLDGILSKMSEMIKESFSLDYVLKRKSVSVFLEMAQNVYYYSLDTLLIDKKQYGIGALMIIKNGENYTFKTGNKISIDYLDTMIERCELVNSLNRNQLRELKRNVRSVESESGSKGAGLGLIQIAITTNEKIIFEYVESDNDTMFFSLSITLSAETTK